MYARVQTAHFSSRRPSSEWHDFDYLHRAKSSRGAAISLLMVLWIAIVDLCWPRTNLSVLYIAPLVMLAWSGDLKPVWRNAGVLVMLTFGVFFLKNTVHAGLGNPSYFDYRLINRGLVAAMIVVMAVVLQLWIRSREEECDAEIPENFRVQEREIGETFAVLCCVPLIVLIAAIDFLMPANYNLAIFYPIPLFICGWTNNRRLLWAMLAMLLLLTVAAHFLGPPSSEPNQELSIARNRILAGLGMIFVTIVLSYWMGGEDAVNP